MSDNVVKLQFDLAQTEAALKKSQELVAKLREEVKKCKDESKNANETAAKGYNKSATEVRTLTKEVESGSSSLRRMGGALNQIGGAGTGQIAQVAGAIGMLATPIGMVVATVGLLEQAWSELSLSQERSMEISKKEIQTQKELADAIAKTNEEKGKRSTDVFKEKQKATSLAGVNAVKYGEEMGRNKGFTDEDTYKILSTTAPLLKNKNKEQIRTLFDTIGKLQVMGYSPTEAASKVRSDDSVKLSAFSDPKLTARRVLSSETGRMISASDFESRYAENLKNPVFFAELQTDINKNKPRPKPTDTKLPPLLEKGKSIEREFPGISKTLIEREKLQKQKNEAETKFRYYQDAFLSADESEILPIMKTYYNYRLSGLTGMGGARAERDTAQETLDANIHATKQNAPWITDEAIKVMGEFVSELRIFNQNMGRMGK
jgi:hypothetical protein